MVKNHCVCIFVCVYTVGGISMKVILFLKMTSAVIVLGVCEGDLTDGKSICSYD